MKINEISRDELNKILVFAPKDSLDLIKIYVNHLIKSNDKINLIGKNTYSSFWTRHIIDSLQLVKYLSRDEIVIDLGSGNGLPGLIIGIAGFETILIEKSKLKSKFLNEAIKLIKIKNIKLINDKAENIDFKKINHNKSIQIISRGFKSILETINLLDNLNILDLKLKLMLLKGENFKTEINDLRLKSLYKFDVEYFKSETGNGFVVLLKNIKKI